MKEIEISAESKTHQTSTLVANCEAERPIEHAEDDVIYGIERALLYDEKTCEYIDIVQELQQSKNQYECKTGAFLNHLSKGYLGHCLNGILNIFQAEVGGMYKVICKSLCVHVTAILDDARVILQGGFGSEAMLARIKVRMIIILIESIMAVSNCRKKKVQTWLTGCMAKRVLRRIVNEYDGERSKCEDLASSIAITRVREHIEFEPESLEAIVGNIDNMGIHALLKSEKHAMILCNRNIVPQLHVYLTDVCMSSVQDEGIKFFYENHGRTKNRLRVYMSQASEFFRCRLSHTIKVNDISEMDKDVYGTLYIEIDGVRQELQIDNSGKADVVEIDLSREYRLDDMELGVTSQQLEPLEYFTLNSRDVIIAIMVLFVNIIVTYFVEATVGFLLAGIIIGEVAEEECLSIIQIYNRFRGRPCYYKHVRNSVERLLLLLALGTVEFVGKLYDRAVWLPLSIFVTCILILYFILCYIIIWRDMENISTTIENMECIGQPLHIHVRDSLAKGEIDVFNKVIVPEFGFVKWLMIRLLQQRQLACKSYVSLDRKQLIYTNITLMRYSTVKNYDSARKQCVSCDWCRGKREHIHYLGVHEDYSWLYEVAPGVYEQCTPEKTTEFVKLEVERISQGQQLIDIYHKEYRYYIENEKTLFPVKSHIGASNKVNMFLSDVLLDIEIQSRGTNIVELLSNLRGYPNDQVCAIILWNLNNHRCGLDKVFCRQLCYAYINNYTALKSLAVSVKQLGVSNCRYQLAVVEIKTLEGRGSVPTEYQSDLRIRLNKNKWRKSRFNHNIDDNILRSCIRQTLITEIKDEKKGEYPNEEQRWKDRWFWAKSGSHKLCSEDKKKYQNYKPWFGMNKRQFMEECELNPLLEDDAPKGEISHSCKLEHGSTRHIYSLDTINYIRFDYVLTFFEQRWRGDSCILDQDVDLKEDYYHNLQYIKEQRGNHALMLDYDSFNNSHTRRHMIMVFEELKRFCPEPLVKHVEWCVESFRHMYINVEGKQVLWQSTLPSGHRATSFLNTILNKCYMMAVLKSKYYSMRWFHCGDDVVAFGQRHIALETLNTVLASKLAIQREKVSVGMHSYEFLRVSVSREYAVGYLNRSLASLVSGNWLTREMVDREEYVSTIKDSLYTLVNRGYWDNTCTFIRRSISRRTGLSYDLCRTLCNTTTSMFDSPVLYTYDSVDESYRKLSVVRTNKNFTTEPHPELERSKLRATEEVLSSIKPIDLKTMGLTHSRMKNLLKRCSYSPRLKQEQLKIDDEIIQVRGEPSLSSPLAVREHENSLDRMQFMSRIRKLSSHSLHKLAAMLYSIHKNRARVSNYRLEPAGNLNTALKQGRRGVCIHDLNRCTRFSRMNTVFFPKFPLYL